MRLHTTAKKTAVSRAIAALISPPFTILSITSLALGIFTPWNAVRAATWPTPVAISGALQTATTNLNQAIKNYTNDPTAANFASLQSAQATFRANVASASSAAALIVSTNDSISPASGELSLFSPEAATIQVNNGATLSIDGFNLGGPIGGTIGIFSGAAVDIEADAGSQIIFSNNTASVIGGAISSSGVNSTLSISNTTFQGNNAVAGGAVNNDSSSVTSIINSNFSGNTANIIGGAIENDTSSLAITNSNFAGNAASLGGGLNNINSSTAVIVNSNFSGNTANFSGGAIENESSSLTITNSNFAGNAASFGGGLNNTNSSTAVIINSNFTENLGLNFGGGAISNSNNTALVIRDSTFARNIADSGGGVRNVVNSTVDIANSSFTQNIATTTTFGGGAIENNLGSTMNVTNSTFKGNGAFDSTGGAIFNAGSTLSISDSSFNGNLAVNGGGLINISNAIASISNSSFTENAASATGVGGAIVNSQVSTLTLINSSFIGNLAGNVAGAIYNDRGTLNLVASAGNQILFSGNAANDKASSISFTSFNGADSTLNAAVDANGLLDMRDPMDAPINSSNTFINKLGAGTWALGGTNLFTQLANGLTSFNVQGGELYLYSQNEVANPTAISPNAMVGAGNIQLKGSGSSFSLSSGAVLVAGGDNSISTDGAISFASGSTIRGANANTALGGSDPTRHESGGTTSLSLSATAGIALNGTVSVVALAANEQLKLSGVLGGSGGLSKTGEGLVVLQSDNNYTGNTTVNAGTLLINGNQSAAKGRTTVNSGTLGGNGTIGGDVQMLGGTISPGNSIGILTILGNYTQNPGSTYLVELNNSGQSDQLVVGGKATINGGAVQVLAANGTYIAGTLYPILTAQAGVSGSYDSLVQNLPFLNLSLIYDANHVYLDVTRSTLLLAAFAATTNQQNTANALETMVASPLVTAITNLVTAPQAQQAFDALSGEGYVSVLSVLTESSRYVREATLNRLQRALGRLNNNLLLLGSKEAKEVDNKNGWGLWAQGYGAWGELEGNRNTAKVDRRNQGFFIGADRGMSERSRLGIIAGYSHSDIDISARRSWADVDNYTLGVYGGALVHGASLRAGAAYTWHRVDMSRQVLFNGFFNPLSANYSAYSGQGFAEIGYPFNLKQLALEPFAGVAYVDVSTKHWQEHGGVAALRGKGSQSTPYSTLGLREATVLYQGERFGIDEQVTLGWQHAYNQVTPKTTFSFISGSSPFNIYGAPIAKNALMVDAGLNWHNLSRKLNFRLSYNGQLAEQAQDHAVTGNVAWYFD
ncbi:Extracellular serine protease precursor [Legionella massiliensis]|uniref:Extracellular serine protease n=1 Tax=Legionella massiliensis TaxID=1034943 RepID=A0A078KZD1_9GAMM|nr:autotransporter domain-containing protein [Legionella massiliensis]CDZ77139.1 Extracellular serine protease precursor [Legionella massiliensis]CEE12877.1 Extracellular serine protease precursor [Legionella massiliensis]